jgi:hypothetical protein
MLFGTIQDMIRRDFGPVYSDAPENYIRDGGCEATLIKLQNEYGNKPKDRVGGLSTMETEKHLQEFVKSVWECCVDKPNLQRGLTVFSLQDLAEFVSLRFHFPNRGPGQATIDEQLNARLQGHEIIEQLLRERQLPIFQSSDKQKSSTIEKLYAVTDCKFASVFFIYLLRYLEREYGMKNETYLATLMMSSHPYIFITLPGSTKAEEYLFDFPAVHKDRYQSTSKKHHVSPHFQVAQMVKFLFLVRLLLLLSHQEFGDVPF